MSLKGVARLAAVALLAAGCAGPMAPVQAPQAPVRPASRFDPTGSWMAPAASTQDLIYVSDTHGKVWVFSYPGERQVGVLQGFKSPAGVCSDASTGDVYVVDTTGLAVLKYKHGGTKPIKTLTMFGYFPFGCAVDPASHDVAVTNISSNPSGPGSLSIFRPGAFFPSDYTNPAFNAYVFCSFDGQGNVLVDGADSGSYHTLFGKWRRGSTTVTTVTLDKRIGYPGGVQWDGTYMAVQDTMSRKLFRFKIAGSRGRSAGTVDFKVDRSSLLHAFWVQGQTIVMPYGTAARLVRMVGRWPYPAGGAPSRSIGVAHAAELVGITVSLAKK
ncbi:MAG TPA: hypothetical protein VIW73_02640 [Candidatus Cybelea sp.]